MNNDTLKLRHVFILAFFLVCCSVYAENNDVDKPTGQIIKVKKSPDTPRLYRVFDRKIVIFGIPVYAYRDVSDRKLRHAASVLAEFLDCDLDGKPDNEDLVYSMRDNNATLIIFRSPDSRAFERFMDRHERSGRNGDDIVKELFAEEMAIINGRRGEFDATLEEVFHLITDAGYIQTYPETLGDSKGSQLAKAMDKARGGYFNKIPRRYPKGAWYRYHDRTCDYSCQVVEYLYWLTTSYLSPKGKGQDFPGRYGQIKHEWKLNNREKVEKGDKLGLKIITNKRYKFPTRLPNGRYPFKR